MSRRPEFLREAETEVEDAAKYYEPQNPGLGARFQVAVETACAAILRDPLLWRERSGGYRRVNLAGFAYFSRAERVLVAAVGHASPQPDDWQRRDFRDRPKL